MNIRLKSIGIEMKELHGSSIVVASLSLPDERDSNSTTLHLTRLNQCGWPFSSMGVCADGNRTRDI
ncbi:hypothetical protein ACTXT7_001853 [Hymenolepis weldensis]